MDFEQEHEHSTPSSSKFLMGLMVAGAMIAVAVVGLSIDIFFNVPDFKQMRDKVEVPIKLANGEKSKKWMGPNSPGWVRLSEISNYGVMAVIASEDTSFYSHQGVDFHELKEAIQKDWKEKKFARGASTITQQVIKNVYLGSQKTIWRKVKEFFWAREIEKVLSKQEIICFYLNMAEWGPGIYGIAEASKHYFGISPGLLTAKQAAFLAMLLPSPVKYYAYFKKRDLTDFSRKRIAQILRILYRMGVVDEGSYEIALNEQLWGVTGRIQDGGLPTDDSIESFIPEDPSDFMNNGMTGSGRNKDITVEKIYASPQPEADGASAVPELEPPPPGDPLPIETEHRTEQNF